ncbi:iron-sulfur cluster assembly scaffold protein [Candidatus Woesearchaeota archaeon]|nr:iron-sulfur cluster assembly scaffold protein [Candidatus Woesearchaeota archaeon]
MMAEEQKAAGENEFDEQLYKEEILELYKHPLNKHALSEYTHWQEKSNPLCGDRIRIYLNIPDQIIRDISFEGSGCAISQAAASLLTEKLKQLPVKDAESLPGEEMIRMLGIPISHLRQKCALLALQAVKAALHFGKEGRGKNEQKKRE